MPLPDRLARLNRHAANPIARPLLGRWPPGGVVVHRGRRSGREYRTPVLAFPDGDGFVVALTYGPDRDWVKNVLGAGGCDLVRGGQVVPLVAPAVVGGAEGLPPIPAPIRAVLRLLKVTAFLRLRRDPDGRTGAAAPAIG